MKKQTLSDKEEHLPKETKWDSEGNCLEWQYISCYPKEDVKEFIKKLKKEMELTYANTLIINKLAGDKLI